jgi:hypothetical protein
METITHIAFVYKWTHLPTGKWYIGCRTAKGCHPEDGYITSSKLVKSLIQTNPEEWQREILHTGSPEEMLNLEVTFLIEADAKNNPLSYNQHNGDGKFTRTGVAVPLETRLKQSESIKKIHSGRGKPGPNRGKKASEETRKKQSLAKLGKKGYLHTPEAKEKIGAAKRGSNHPSYGKPLTDEHKQKLRDAFVGKKKSLVTCPHCGKEGGGGAMIRHHYNNCKQKEEQNELGRTN